MRYLIHHPGTGTLVDPDECEVIAYNEVDENGDPKPHHRMSLSADDLNPTLRISYTPEAIREHYEDDDENALAGLDDDDLRAIGQVASDGDSTWHAYAEGLDQSLVVYRESIRERLDWFRAGIRAENISYGELAELQDLADHIDLSDVELLEWAGVPEFHEDDEDTRCWECRKAAAATE